MFTTVSGKALDPPKTSRGVHSAYACIIVSVAVVRRWRDSCQKFHPGWTHMFWDNQAAEELLLERYPWFMDTWRSYPRVVHRGGLHMPLMALASL